MIEQKENQRKRTMTALAEVESNQNIPQSTSHPLMELISRMATDPNADVEKLEKMLDVKERWETNEARKAFIAALADFKANPPTLVKDTLVDYTSQKGRTTYRHATLGRVSAIVAASLGAHGLSHRWETSQEQGLISVTCVLTHEMGHSERVTLRAAADPSGGKNAIQAIGSTVSYLQRYTLLAAVGLAAEDQDDDGQGGGAPIEYISEEQAANLQSLIDEVGADKHKFLAWIKADSLSGIQASAYDMCVKALEAKRKAGDQ